MESINKSVWNTLSAVDVNKYAEKKNGFTYLSWAWAWSMLKDHYPDATYHKHIFNGLPYMLDPNGYGYVQVTVSVPSLDSSCTEIMPVLNHANKPIQNPDSFEVNKSLQRCLAKAIAALGLGAYLFQGEDLPQSIASNPAPSAPPPAKDFKKATGMSLEQEIRIAPDMESLKALYNRVSLSLTPEQRALFSQRKQEISNG
jgi:hypothetical protein